MRAVRRIGIAGPELAAATCGTIRAKLLKIGALVTISVRRAKLAFTSACPERAVFELNAGRLCANAAAPLTEPERQQHRIIVAPARAARSAAATLLGRTTTVIGGATVIISPRPCPQVCETCR